MAPKQPTSGRARGAPSKGKSTARRSEPKPAADSSELDPFAEEEELEDDDAPSAHQHRRGGNRVSMDLDDEEDHEEVVEDEDGEEGEEDDDEDDEDDDGDRSSIPPELLTRLLHEFFEKDGSRISRDANSAVAKYMDVFVRETIARTAQEKASGFLEVEDLEKVAPQVLLDL